MMAATTPSFEQDYFDRFYRNYDRQNPLRKMAFYHDLVRRAAPGVVRPRVLDLGCAFGRFLGSAGGDWEKFGADVSRFAIERARQEVAGATFRVGGLPEIPFDDSFDVIVAFDVIEHVDDLEAVAAAVTRRLAPGAGFVFVVPVYDGPTGPIIRALDRDVTHVHRDSRWFWLDWAGRHFRVTDWCGIYRYYLPWGYYLHLPTRRLRRFTPAIAVSTRARG